MIKAPNSSNLTRNLYFLVFVSIALLSILSWWLLSDAFQQHQQAKRNSQQFAIFYRVLTVSNNLATERAYTHEFLLSTEQNSETARANLEQIRQLTDHNLQLIPRQKRNTPLLIRATEQLETARQLIDDTYQHRPLTTQRAKLAIDTLMQATNYYHQAVYSKTDEFIQVVPNILGPILRAQALGELRDLTGRLGAAFLIPLHSRSAITSSNQENIIQLIERINLQWWLLSTYNSKIDGGTHFESRIEQAQNQFAKQGLSLVKRLINESQSQQPYSITPEQFAIEYHDSLSLFNDLLPRYVSNLQRKFQQDENDAFSQLLVTSLIILMLATILISILLIVRKKLLQPVMTLNQMVLDIVNGRSPLNSLEDNTADEVKTLLASLDKLGNQLSQQKELSQKLKQQSNEDPLTSLYNRRAFDAHAMQLMYSSSQQYPVWLTVIDLDHFKAINDTWGHLEGDQVLIQMGKLLQAQKAPNELIARTGGEEFIVMFIESDPVRAKNKLAQLKQTIESTEVITQDGETIRFTASFGLARGYQCSITALVSQADKFLYQAKNNGRNCICGHEFTESIKESSE